MSRLPTVTLFHKKHGKIIVNETDYAANIGGWVNDGWKRVGEKGDPIEVNSTPEPALVGDAPLADAPGAPEPPPPPDPKPKPKGGR